MTGSPDGEKPSRIVALIDDHPKTLILLRAASRSAKASRKPWTALHVSTPSSRRIDREARERLTRFQVLATQLGGAVATVEARDVAKGLFVFLGEATPEGGDEIFVGRTSRDGLFVMLRSGLGEHLEKRFRGRATVQIIPLTGEGELLRWWTRDAFQQTQAGSVVAALGAVGVAYLATELLSRLVGSFQQHLDIYGAPLVFLVACMFAASRIGIIAGIVATGCSALAIIHLSMRGASGFVLGGMGSMLNLALFLAAASLVTIFAGYSHASAEGAFRREKRTQALFKMNRLTANAHSRDDALAILHEILSELLDMQIAYFLPPALHPDRLVAAYPTGVVLDPVAEEALAECWRESTATGFGTPEAKPTHWRFEPLVTPGGEIGVMALQIPEGLTLESSFVHLLGSLADHSAAILERVELARSSEANRIVEEREKLRSMLLSSVSHDLKTPLASVIGSLSVYQTMAASLPVERRELLLQTALDEAQRLDSFISNILDMTRLESGDIRAKVAWIEPVELLHRVKKRLRQRLQRHHVEILAVEGGIEVRLDQMLTEQVLGNLFDNAAKYSPAGSEITLSVEHDATGFRFVVRDRGPGIPAGKEDAIFDKYSRLKREDSQVAGTGLGLAISRAIMTRQGGSIEVSNHPDGGAVFTLHFPTVRKIDADNVLNDS